MKLNKILKGVLAVILLSCTAVSAQEQEPVTGFLVDLERVDDLLERGAVDIQIFAAYDVNNKPFYVMTGLDSKGAMIEGQVYRQNETGDCPPSCDFLPTALTNGGAFIEKSEASTLVNNYLKAHKESENAVKICAYSINKVKNKGYHYMRITFERNVKVTGVKDDGKIRWFAPFTNSCNTHFRSAMGDY